MTEKINRIQNPLTIIAIFAALAEVNATVAISLIDKNLHHIFIWFIIGFPTILIIAFFLTLNFNTKVIYAPSDYKDDKNFMDVFGGNYGNKNDTEKSTLNQQVDLPSIEKIISDKLQAGIEGIVQNNSVPNDNLEQIKSDIKNLTEQTIKNVSNENPNQSLKEQLMGFIRHPSNFLLLATIYKGNITNQQSIPNSINIYNLPKGWKTGIDRLLAADILIGTRSEFSINPDYIERIAQWVNKYDDKFIEISEILNSKDEYLENNRLDEWSLKTLNKSIQLVELI